jgi:hypothetical protein
MSVELHISSSPFFKYVLMYTHVSVGVFTRTFFYPVPGLFNFSAHEARMKPGCISQALRQEKIYLYDPFFSVNCDVILSTIIPELCR